MEVNKLMFTIDEVKSELEKVFSQVKISSNFVVILWPPYNRENVNPQINIDFPKLLWRGYYSTREWGYPFGAAMGNSNYYYVIPKINVKCTKWVQLHKDDVVNHIISLTNNFISIHPPDGKLKDLPIPDGYRIATSEEIKESQ